MTNRQRTLALFEPYPHLLGGAQRTSVLLAGALREIGLEVVAVAPAPGAYTAAMADRGVPVKIVPPPPALRVFGHRTTGRAATALPALWSDLRRCWRAIRPGMVAASNLRGALLCGPSAVASGARLAWHVHLPEPNPLLNTFAGVLADVTVLPSGAVHSAPRWTRTTTVVIPNAVDDEAFSVEAGPVSTAPHLVTCGRLTPQKGLDVLVEAMASVRHRHPAVSATVFGGPQTPHEGYLDRLHRRIRDLDMEDAVHFVGDQERPYLRYPPGAIYVQPSRQEILPLATIEAMAGGLPVVASDVGGMADAVVDEQTGILVPPGLPAPLARAIEHLATDPDRATEMGRAGKARAGERFRLTAMAQRWAELIGGHP